MWCFVNNKNDGKLWGCTGGKATIFTSPTKPKNKFMSPARPVSECRRISHLMSTNIDCAQTNCNIDCVGSSNLIAALLSFEEHAVRGIADCTSKRKNITQKRRCR